MKKDEEIEMLAKAWKVETEDLTSKVRAAIGLTEPKDELIQVIQALRQEVADLRRTSELLQDELFRLRMELHAPAPAKQARISPYFPVEPPVRLS